MDWRALGLAGLLAVPLVACAATPHPRTPAQEEALVLSADKDDAGTRPEHVPFDGRARAIIAQPEDQHYGQTWEVSLEDAERADDGVQAFLDENRPELGARLPDYVGQIFGIIDDDGKRRILLNYMCKSAVAEDEQLGRRVPELASRADWQHNVIVTYDGGDCYFHLDFDPESGEYDHLIVNGQA